MYHPLLVFDGDTGQLICAILRPGTVHASQGAKAILKRLVKALRQQWPEVQIEFRADSGSAVPELYEYLEQEQIPDGIGLPTNRRLQALAAPLVAEAQQQHAQSGEKVRLVGEAQDQAGSWEHQRRVVIKAEVLANGPNVRFVVTTRGEKPEALYDWYIQWGDRLELCIKDLKQGCRADRLSDHAFWANQFRLLLHAAAYGLLDTLRRWLMERRVPRMELATLRLQLLKIGGCIWPPAIRANRSGTCWPPSRTDQSRAEDAI